MHVYRVQMYSNGMDNIVMESVKDNPPAGRPHIQIPEKYHGFAFCFGNRSCVDDLSAGGETLYEQRHGL